MTAYRQKNSANGVAGLDTNGLVSPSVLPNATTGVKGAVLANSTLAFNSSQTLNTGQLPLQAIVTINNTAATNIDITLPGSYIYSSTAYGNTTTVFTMPANSSLSLKYAGGDSVDVVGFNVAASGGGSSYDDITEDNVTKVINIGNTSLGSTNLISPVTYMGLNRNLILVSSSELGNYLNYSTDGGVTFTPTNYPSLVGTNQASIITYKNQYYLGNYRSDNGISWTNISTLPTSVADWGTINNVLVFSTSGAGIYYSLNNGATWTASNKVSGSFRLRYVNNRLFAISNQDSQGGIWYSDNGTTWTQGIFGGVWETFNFNGNMYIASSFSGSSVGTYYSYDGINWTLSTSNIFGVMVYSYPLRRWIAGRAQAQEGLYYSNDGINWTLSNVSIGVYLGMAFNNSIVVAADAIYSVIRYSFDGITWATVSGITLENNPTVKYNFGKFWIMSGRRVYSSVDGINWTNVNFTAYVRNQLFPLSMSSIQVDSQDNSNFIGESYGTDLVLSGSLLGTSSSSNNIYVTENSTAGGYPVLFGRNTARGYSPVNAHSGLTYNPNTNTITAKSVGIISGATNQILYQSSAGVTGFLPAPTLANTYLQFNGSSFLWSTISSGGVSAIGTINSETKSANGAVINGSSLVLQTADATNPGLVSAGTQTFAGSKTFNDTVTFSADIGGSKWSIFSTNGNCVFDNGAISSNGSGVLTASSFSGNADTATSINGGTANQLVYQSAINTTGFISNGTTGQVLTATTGSAPSFQSLPVGSSAQQGILQVDGTTITATGGVITALSNPAINVETISGNITLNLTQIGNCLYSTTATAETVTIPLNASVAFPIGTTINIVLIGNGSVQIIPDAGVSLYLAGSSTNGSRTISPYGIATLLQVNTDVWVVNGTGVY